MEKKHFWTVFTIASIWLAIMFTSIFSNDLVTGTDPTRLPIAAIISPFCGAVATLFVLLLLLLGRRAGLERSHVWMALVIAIIWLAVALTSIFTPDLVTGVIPTRLPIAAIISPIVGAIVTGLVCGFVWLWGWRS